MSAPPAAPALEAVAVSKRFGGRDAVREVALAVRPGERLAVVGPNGAGKTTLLSILAGVLPPGGGEVRAAGAVGWVPQQPAVYAKLTVAENLRLFARLEKVDDVDAAVARMLDQTGLADRADDRLGTLSGGTRQRVNVAVGLVADPRVLLLDEPSSALDPLQRERLWEFVTARAQAGTAVVFTTHELGEADRHADRVVVLAGGTVRFDGPPADLRGDERDLEAAFVRFLHEQGEAS